MSHQRSWIFKAVAVSVFCLSLPATVWAWNIICGVSILSAGQPGQLVLEGKWDADSHSLRGIAYYYLAISELQRIDLHTDGTFAAPRSFDNSGTTIQSAIKDFQRSSTEFDTALALASKNHLGDDQGIGLLKKMKQDSAGFADDMTTKKHLPDLAALQGMANDIQSFTGHGIQLSQEHLAHGLAGHGVGGVRYKIK